MSVFEIVHQDRIAGKLTCFDRLVFKGYLTRLYRPGAMKGFLDSQHVLLVDFASYVTKMSERVKAHATAMAEGAGRRYLYLAEAHTRRNGISKEELARSIAERDGVTEGLVCVLCAVELCQSFDIYKIRDTHRLDVVRRARKCLHSYFYFLHPELGFCHVRLQGWFPFEVQVWINGREALSQALTQRRVPHTRYLNAIAKAANWGLAQRLADRLVRRRWDRVLSGLARQVNPHLALFQATLAGEHAIAGFRNKYFTRKMYCRPLTDETQRFRRCQRASRMIAKLRGLGLVAKVPRTRRYRVTAYAQRVMTTVMAFHDREFPAAYAASA